MAKAGEPGAGACGDRAAEAESASTAIDRVGEDTLELFAENPAYNELLWRRLSELAPVTGRVLEVGCGIGTITSLILREAGVTAVHGIDMDPAYVRRVLELGDPRLGASACSMEECRLPRFPEAADESWDRIVCSNVLEHIEDDLETMRQFARMLRPGGVALILVPAHQWLYSSLDRNLSHFRRYRRADLQRLAAESGLELVRSRYFNPVGIAGWWLNGKVLRRDTLPVGQLRAYGRWAVSLSALVDRLNPLPCGISVTGAFRRP